MREPLERMASLTSSRRCALEEFLLENAFSLVLQIRGAGKWISANRSAINASSRAAEAFRSTERVQRLPFLPFF